MTKPFDLTSKLTRRKPEIELDGKVYKVNNSAETVLIMEHIMDKDYDSHADMLYAAIGHLTGDEFVDVVKKNQLSLADVEVTFISLMSLIQEEDFEVAYDRFQREKDKD